MATPLLSCDFNNLKAYNFERFKNLFSIHPGLNSDTVSCSDVKRDGAFTLQHLICMGLYLTNMFQRKYAGPLRDTLAEATGGQRDYKWENKIKETHLNWLAG